MPKKVSPPPLDATGLDAEFYRADIEVHGIEHGGATYQARIFLNNPRATERSAMTAETGFAGTFHIFGHGGCLGDPGHCDVVARDPHDPRPAHPLTPAHKIITATDAIRRALQSSDEIRITFVPVIMSTTPAVGRPDDVLKFDQVRIITYR
jgi:tyrosinase